MARRRSRRSAAARTAWGDRVDDPLVLRDLRPDAHHPQGTVRPYLFSDDEIDLVGIVRAGGSDDEIADARRAVTWRKRAGHAGLDEVVAPQRSMGAIGG